MKALLAGVAALLLLGAAFAGGYFIAGGPPAGEAGPAAETPAQEGGKPAPPAGGPVEPAKAEAAAPPAVPVRPVISARPDDGRISIELGAFRSADNAQLFASALAERGLPVEIVETMDAAGQSWQRVRAGAFSDRWQAEARLREYERISGLAGIIVMEPPATVPSRPAAAKAGGGE